MSRSLFEEAIADAKQLREAAEQNAKNAIIEAVTPRIREFIENQLVGGTQNENSDDFLRSAISESDLEEEEVTLDETALRSLANLMNGTDSSKSSPDSAALSEAWSSLSEEDQARLFSLLREEDNKENEGDSTGTYEIDLDELKDAIVSEIKTSKVPTGAKKMSKRIVRESMDEDLYELDEMMDEKHGDNDMSYDELAEAVLKLVGNPDEREAFDKLGLDSIEFEDEVSDNEDIEVGEEMPPEESSDEEMPPEEEAPLAERVYELDENMLRRELSRIREAKAGKKSTAKTSNSVTAKAFGGGTTKGAALDVNINELDAAKNKVMKEVRENRALKTQLNDYRGAVETLREQLSDLNLFNAKLLYVNKILQNKDVAPTQRRAIIEALDGAANLREAKLLYQSLTSSITTKNESLSESVKHTAGLASRPVTTSSARMSGANEVDRWATLAGLK
jgi:hypothetical protein